jgi:hypothetical protein
MNRVRPFIFLSFFLLFAIAGCGTLGMIVGPVVTGVTIWANGEAHRYYEENPEEICRAVQQTLTELKLPITQNRNKNNKYYIVAGERNRFSITIVRAEGNLTKLNIRINFFGDKNYAEFIYKKVDSQINVIHFDENGMRVDLQQM